MLYGCKKFNQPIGLWAGGFVDSAGLGGHFVESRGQYWRGGFWPGHITGLAGSGPIYGGGPAYHKMFYGATSFDQVLPWRLDYSGYGFRRNGIFGGGCKGSIEGHTNDGEGTPHRDY